MSNCTQASSKGLSFIILERGLKVSFSAFVCVAICMFDICFLFLMFYCFCLFACWFLAVRSTRPNVEWWVSPGLDPPCMMCICSLTIDYGVWCNMLLSSMADNLYNHSEWSQDCSVLWVLMHPWHTVASAVQAVWDIQWNLEQLCH